MRSLKLLESPNRLLIVMIAVSFGIHLLAVMRAAGLYRIESRTYLDVSVQDTSRPMARAIPRPRVRHKAPEIQDVPVLNIRERRIPQIKTDLVESRPEAIQLGDVGLRAGDVAVPEAQAMSGVAGLNVAQWVPPAVVSADFMTKQDYMEMVRLRIESRKKYPESARSSRIEGRVKVRFTVDPEGRVVGAEVMKGSGNQTLDDAALSTVKDASPLPKAPPGFFKGSFQMEIILAFELR